MSKIGCAGETSLSGSVDQHRPMVFVSYASVDRSRVDPFADALERIGIDVWMDYRRLKAGQNWNTEIRRALGKAAVIVIFMSEHSVDRRGYAQREIKIALEQAEEKLLGEIYIVPILLDELPEYPEPIRHLHAISASSSDAESQLLDAVSHQLEKLGNQVQALQSETNIRWTEKSVKEGWDGLPGYEFEYNLFQFSSPEFSNIGDVTTIIHGSLSEICSFERRVKFEQEPEHYNFGQKRFFRTRSLEIHCRQPVVVGRVMSLLYSAYRYAGGAHGNSEFYSFVFTLDPVTRINSLSELFIDQDSALNVIQNLSRAQLLNNLASCDGGSPTAHKDWVDDGTQKWSDFDAFTIAETGIEITFAPYQVAAYAYGPQLVVVSNEDIYELLRPEFLAAIGWDSLRWRATNQALLQGTTTQAQTGSDPTREQESGLSPQD